MKKIFVLFLLILSYCARANEYSYFCSQNFPKKNFSGFISSATGVNLLSRNVIEHIIEKTIKRETNAKFKVKINNFYSINLLNGEFASLYVKAKKYEHDGIYLSNINVNTLCGYNHVLFEEEKLYFIENIVLKLNAEFTSEQLKKTIVSGKLNKKLAKLLNKILKNEVFIAIANTFLPITLPIKIDDNNKGQLKITNIYKSKNNLAFESYILIPKNK